MASAPTTPLSLKQGILLGTVAVACFQAAYSLGDYVIPQVLIVGYVICLAQLARLETTRQAFYTGLLTAVACFGPQLVFFWKLFCAEAILLWLVLAFWIGLFVALTQATRLRWGMKPAALLLPFIWTGLEYFRSELYYLKFSWLSPGYALIGWHESLLPYVGTYGCGFLIASIAAVCLLIRRKAVLAIITLCLLTVLQFVVPKPRAQTGVPNLRVAGVQLEFPAIDQVLTELDHLVEKEPNAPLFVLSEYTLDGPVPETLKAWCQKNGRYLIVGGKDPADGGKYFDTAFVVGPTGEIVFKQAKSVPIPFLDDGLPATHQSVWNSPWGRIGICICYDASYTRVVDRLVQQGAQLIVVPSMDVAAWGVQEHESNARVGPVRAAEYGVPLFRLASSGISEAIDASGGILARAPYPGEGATLAADIVLAQKDAIPLDRCLAPFSVGIAGLLLATQLLLRKKRRPSDPAHP